MQPTVNILPMITRGGFADCRRIVHRTSPERARQIIRERKIFGVNSAVSFSVIPGQINQAEHSGAILIFEWSGPIRTEGDVEQNELLHVFSDEYVESLIKRPSSGGFLALVGIIEPDLIKFEDTREDAMGQIRTVINHKTKVFLDEIVVTVV